MDYRIHKASPSRWIVVLGLGVLLMLALAACSTQGAATSGTQSGPRLVFDQTEVDFGKVAFNKTVEHAFTYRNVGTAPVSIIEKPQVEIKEGC